MGFLRDMWSRYDRRRMGRAMAPIFGQINENIRGWYGLIFRTLGEKGMTYLAVKWPGLAQVDDRSGTPRTTSLRPRSTGEIASVLSVSPDEVRAADQAVMKVLAPLYEEMNDAFQSMFAWVKVPVDEAAAWWDAEHGEHHFPDGDWRIKCPNCLAENEVPDDQLRGEASLLCANCSVDIRRAWDRA